MAPSLTETLPVRAPPVATLKTDAGFNKENLIGYGEAYSHNDEIKGTAKQPPASFPNYLPVWDNETERYVFSRLPSLVLGQALIASFRYPPLTLFDHYDHGKDADPSFPDLLPKGKAETDDLTPTIGTEVNGVQLSQLTKEGKDQLALYVAQRKVVGKSMNALVCLGQTNVF